MSRRARVVLGAAAAGALLAGCGIPTDSNPRRLEDVPFGLVAPPTTEPDDTIPDGSVYVAMLYFISGTRLVGVELEVPQAPTVDEQGRVVLRALANGPRDNMPQLRTALPPDAEMNVTVRGSVATVELDEATLDVVAGEQLMAIGQIVLSLTRLSPIVDVQFTAGGQPVFVPLPDARTADGPVKASDYLPLLTS